MGLCGWQAGVKRLPYDRKEWKKSFISKGKWLDPNGIKRRNEEEGRGSRRERKSTPGSRKGEKKRLGGLSRTLKRGGARIITWAYVQEMAGDRKRDNLKTGRQCRTKAQPEIQERSQEGIVEQNACYEFKEEGMEDAKMVGLAGESLT